MNREPTPTSGTARAATPATDTEDTGHSVGASRDWAAREWSAVADTAYFAWDPINGTADEPVEYTPVEAQESLAALYAQQAREHPDADARRRFVQLSDQAHARAQALRDTQPQRDTQPLRGTRPATAGDVLPASVERRG
jgi:hypothetical protein